MIVPPRALLLHGLGASPADLGPIAAALEAAGWVVESPALLGHDGRPPAPRYALDDYAAELAGSGPWDLVVGHSLGGSVATLLGARSARWTAGLLLIEPVWRIRAEHIDAVAAGQRADLDMTDAELEAATPRWSATTRAAKLAALRSVVPAAVEATFRDTVARRGGWDLRDEAARLAVPTRVLASDPEVGTMVDEDDARLVIGHASHLRLRRVAGTGHGVHRDDPAAVLVELDELLAPSGGLSPR